MDLRPRLGVSACLLGQRVRFDGRDKEDRFLTGTWAGRVDFVPLCPEVECGLGLPRAPMRLEGDPQAPRLVVTRTGEDLTARMEAWTGRRLEELGREDLWGFIFKSRSPSCGPRRVKVRTAPGRMVQSGVGLFARAVQERWARLPVEDEEGLADPGLRENFVTRLFTFQRWGQARAGRLSRSRLAAFHLRHELLLLAHSPRDLARMNRLVAQAPKVRPAELFAQYEALLGQALRLKATRPKNARVLSRVRGRLGDRLTAGEKEELEEMITLYRRGRVPLLACLTLIKPWLRRGGPASLREQVYLQPDPEELSLKDHA